MGCAFAGKPSKWNFMSSCSISFRVSRSVKLFQLDTLGSLT